MSTKSPKKQEINIKVAKETPSIGLRRDMWLLLGILLLTIFIYSNTLRNGFVYHDDPESVVSNPYIQQISLENLIHYFTTPVQYMYMPLAMVSWAVDYQIGQLNPFIYHLDNLILHLGCVVLVFGVFQRLTKNSRMALLVTLLFAIHPVNVDTVAWVATRTNLLATLFYLGALLCYSLYIEKNGQLRYLALACLSFFLGASARSTAVVLPLILFLWDYFYGRPWSKKLLVEKIPFFVVALFFGMLTLTMRTDPIGVPHADQYNLLDRVLIFFYALADYPIRLLFPLQLSLVYAYPTKTGPWLPLQFYFAPIILVLIVWGLYKLKVSKKVLIVGLAFFVLNIVLTQSVLLMDNFMANRYIYLSYLGLYLILADINERALGASPTGASPIDWQSKLRVGWVAGLVIFVASFALLTFNRNYVWFDTMTLFNDVIEKQPGVAWAYGTRGAFRLHNNDLNGARQDLDQALKLDPNYSPSLYFRANLNYLSQDYPAALVDLDQALAQTPNMASLYRDRGKVKGALQDNQGALDDFNRAIALDPQSDAYYWRAVIKNTEGDYQAALADLNIVIEQLPDYAAAFYLRGIVKLNLNDKAGACDDVAQALSLGYQPSADQAGPSCP